MRFYRDIFGELHYKAGGPDWLDDVVFWCLTQLFDRGLIESFTYVNRGSTWKD